MLANVARMISRWTCTIEPAKGLPLISRQSPRLVDSVCFGARAARRDRFMRTTTSTKFAFRAA